MGFSRPNVGGMLSSLIDIAMAAVRIPPEEKLSPTAPLMEEINGFWLSAANIVDSASASS
jgi:hypothetical protein